MDILLYMSLMDVHEFSSLVSARKRHNNRTSGLLRM